MITIQIGMYEGCPIYADISDKEYDELLKAGFSHDEIHAMYQYRDWQADC